MSTLYLCIRTVVPVLRTPMALPGKYWYALQRWVGASSGIPSTLLHLVAAASVHRLANGDPLQFCWPARPAQLSDSGHRPATGWRLEPPGAATTLPSQRPRAQLPPIERPAVVRSSSQTLTSLPCPPHRPRPSPSSLVLPTHTALFLPASSRSGSISLLSAAADPKRQSQASIVELPNKLSLARTQPFPSSVTSASETSNRSRLAAMAQASSNSADGAKGQLSANDKIQRFAAPSRPLSPLPAHALFNDKTRCFVYGLQPRAVQGMLDFDFICKRKTPSVAGIIYTFGGQFVSKMYWGTSETLLPVYQAVDKAVAKHPDVDVVVNFASSRSVYSSTMELMENPQIKTIAIIAEGVPERRAREIAHVAKKKGVTIIGPATVGGIKPGSFKIGNTGGMMDNIVASKLYRKGSVGYVSKSGGMSNELNNIISQNTDGVYEGIAIGGDRYPGTTFIDHMLRYQADPECKILVLLGEVGGVEEYKVIDAVKQGVITKPIVAWAIGTCASMFKTEVQFGHAGSFANSQLETAAMKNKMMREAGFHVPNTFEDMPAVLKDVYDKLVKSGNIKPQPEPVVPKIPIDYSWAQELGLIRKPAAFISTISDDRGQELLYAGMPISDVFREEIGIGGVMSLLWFRRRLPDYASKFLEMVLMLTADHGPAVSGAMNTIITTRAGKDLISALVSGLLTIGSRFGGALDGAAEEFTKAFDKNLSPREFVDNMRKANKLIPGIGHRVKSRNNPDLRVELVKEYVLAKFPSHKLLDYALAVETVTTSKKDNLILNVDGCIAVCFVDLLRNCGAFSADEAEEYLSMGVLNGLFVLGRSIGLIAHYLDQKRLRTGLYRHPWDDITYLLPNLAEGRPGAEGRVEVQM
ncbi:ATP-citrate synthase subunit 1 [Drechmeria coniospora]|uniref:ATP citrate synthase n=1 Tax=Drechmeria coniospora TaxID=98403 RepID=A0A151GDZ1_DRECN|nr:ATP-citrate synthase subunit 1 [Drechmeria coniospora]KYK55304.1 ATP-citrate synthase subunit 1 [Drechmeria coniospora]